MRIRRWLLYVCVVLGLLYFVACQTLDGQMNSRDDEGLARYEIETETEWTLSFLAAGSPEDPRIIYVHGTPGSAHAFKRYLARPIDGYESISIDRPGFGKTTPRKPALRLEEQSKIIEPLLVERAGALPVLVGHSLGGPIVCRVAADYPDRVGAVVILAGSLDPNLEKIRWYQYVGEFLFIPYLIPRALRNANREVFPLKEELEELRPLLAKIQCPVYIVHATNDSLVPFANVEYMKRELREEWIEDIVVLKEKDHFLPWNAEQLVRDTVVSAAQSAATAEPASIDTQ